jgi:sugar lactone lactonase YvrE
MNFSDNSTTHSVTRRHLASRGLASYAAALLSAAALTLSLTGCALGNMTLSGPEPGQLTGAMHVSGTVHGGQNPVSGSTIQLWAVGSAGYGSAATPLVLQNGSGGTCSASTLSITGFAIASNVVTLLATNTLTAGESVTISGLSTATYLNGLTFPVISASGSSFTVAFTHANVSSTSDSGTAAPLCPGVTTNAAGSFNLNGTYTCPSSSSLIYITASGGNPGLATGTNNTAIEMMAPLGACNTLANTTVTINEVTTVAGAFALAQYFTPTFGANSADSFGAPNTTQAQTGITNAFATVNNLVSTSTGVPVSSIALTGTLATSYPYTISVVPDQAKIYTMANILGACVNTTSASSSNCTALFGGVVTATGTTPTDVLQAAVYMALNPTSTNATASSTNLTNLYNLQSPTSPFVGPANSGLSAAPIDWTVAIQYQDTNGNYFLKPQNLAIDSTGNVWVLSNSSASGALVELSPTGTPTNFVTTLNEYGPFASPVASPPVLSSLKTTQTEPFGYQNTVFTNNFGNVAGGLDPAVNPRNMAIDTNNDVWFTVSSSTTDATTSIPSNGNVFEVTPAGASYGFATGKAAYGLAIDGNNDVFVSQQSSSAYFGMFEFPAGNLLTPITYQIASKTVGTPAASGTNSYIQPEYMAFDTAGNLWMTAGSSSTSQNFAVALGNINTGALVTGNTATAAYPCATLTSGEYCYVATSTTANTYYTTSIAITEPWALAAGANGTIYIADAGTSSTAPDYTVTKISGTASPASATFANLGTSASIVYPHYLAVDGSGNVWVGSQGGTVGSSTVSGGIAELNSAGTALSPTSSATQPGFAHSTLAAAAGVGIDPSGNVWVANNVAYTAATTGTSPTPAIPSLVLELVGAAAPTVTPIALALKNGTVAAKP